MNINNLRNNRKIQILTAVVLLSLALLFLRDGNPATLDANFGIEFNGGIRIPITLEKPVDADTMSSMVDLIKSRINKFGLSQAIVKPLGNKEIIVEIPKADAHAIDSVERILREQGRFEAIIDGKLALSGEHILTNAVGGSGAEEINTNPDGSVGWTLVFAISGDGELKFAEIARGKTGLPVHMFLDRPENAAIILSQTDLTQTTFSNVIQDALRKQDGEKDDSILLVYVDEVDKKKTELMAKDTIVLSEDLRNSTILATLRELGFSESLEAEKKLVFKPQVDMAPSTGTYGTGLSAQTVLVSWPAIGLQSAPTLQVEPIAQKTITQYSISGTARGDTSDEQEKNAKIEIKELKTVLSGGRLPVSTYIGSYYEVEPSLGTQFLYYSMVGIFLAVIAVAIIIIARYRKIALAIPIIATNVIEIVILIALLGTFGTLDLAAMAGVIALIGTGVDNQIIITDELLTRRKQEEVKRSATERLKRAFEIVFATAGVAIAAMLPLLLSGIVEVSGFALATILGVTIGVLVTRPAYGAIVEELFGAEASE